MSKVLAIDDNFDNLVTIKALLKLFISNCDVIIASSGQEGIQKAISEQPDTILLDIHMPGMDGFEVCQKLKDQPETASIPIVMVTAVKTDTKNRVKALDLGADAFLTKPINEAELAAQVKAMLRIKKAEDILRNEKEQLEDIVQQRLDELIIEISERKELEKQLQQSQKMESIGTLAGGIAHDFNNLLFPIIGFAEMLKDDLPSGSPEKDSAHEILKAGIRGGELVKQILAFSRQTEHDLKPVRFQKILIEVLKLTRSTIPSNIEINQNIQPDCGLVMAEATQLHQIAMNLITNAFHAVERASGTIFVQLKEVMLDDGDLKDSSLQSGPYAMLTVSDNGIGIPGDVINNIFEPYFSTKEKGKGTGLGLAVVYGILKEHKGDIKVFSDVGEGTTFKVYLPLIKKTARAILKDPILDPQTGIERLLLVDDEKSIVQLEKQMLERLGYDVTIRSSSLEALEAFKNTPDGFDLVVTDMTMPNMTGDQLAQELISIRPDIPIIICTGFSERINGKQSEIPCVKGILMKPVVKSDLARMVRKVLDESNDQRQR